MPRHLIAAALLALTPLPSWAQVLTETEIASAVQAGQAGASPQLTCVARGSAGGLFSGSFTVRVEGPLGHIMRLSAEAKRKYQPFTVADVTEAMLAPVLRVLVEPDQPTQRGRRLVTTPIAQHVVLKPTKARDALQAATKDAVPVTWGNVFGGRVDGQGLLATFPLDAFRALPDGDVEAIIVTDGGERRCTLPVKQRRTFR